AIPCALGEERLEGVSARRPPGRLVTRDPTLDIFSGAHRVHFVAAFPSARHPLRVGPKDPAARHSASFDRPFAVAAADGDSGPSKAAEKRRPGAQREKGPPSPAYPATPH